ncbi:MAG: hypothetical protein WC506_03130 [Candidatus Micrarchaeia archaeon]
MTILSFKSARANEPKQKQPVDYQKSKNSPYKNIFLTVEQFQSLGTSKFAKANLLSTDGKETKMNYTDKELDAIKKLSSGDRLALPIDWDTQAPLSVDLIGTYANLIGKFKSSNQADRDDAAKARAEVDTLIKLHQDAAKKVDELGLHGSNLYYMLMFKAEFLSEVLGFMLTKAQAIGSNSAIANEDKRSLAEQKKNLLAAYGQVTGKDYAQKVAGIAGAVFSMGSTFLTGVKEELIKFFSNISSLPNTLYLAAAGTVSVLIGFGAYYGIDIMKAMKQNRIIRAFDKAISHRTYQEVSINRLHVTLVMFKAMQLMAEYGMLDELSRKTSKGYFALAYRGDFEALKEIHNSLERRVNEKMKKYLGEETKFKSSAHTESDDRYKTIVSGMFKDGISSATAQDGSVDVKNPVETAN